MGSHGMLSQACFQGHTRGYSQAWLRHSDGEGQVQLRRHRVGHSHSRSLDHMRFQATAAVAVMRWTTCPGTGPGTATGRSTVIVVGRDGSAGTVRLPGRSTVTVTGRLRPWSRVGRTRTKVSGHSHRDGHNQDDGHGHRHRHRQAASHDHCHSDGAGQVHRHSQAPR